VTVIMDVPIPGVDPWDDFVRAPFLWHFALHAVPRLPERLVTGREPDALAAGFDLTRTFELTGDFAAGLTGRAGALTRHAILAHGQRLVELVEYVSPADTETFRPRPCGVGSVHVAGIGAALTALAAAGRVALELTQLVPSRPGRQGERP
jgi:hypothetical protein